MVIRLMLSARLEGLWVKSNTFQPDQTGLYFVYAVKKGCHSASIISKGSRIPKTEFGPLASNYLEPLRRDLGRFFLKPNPKHHFVLTALRCQRAAHY